MTQDDIAIHAPCWQQGDYTIDTDPRRLDLAHCYELIANSYWAQGIPFDTFRRSVEGSCCFGIYHGEQQVGFARVITDYATVAYLGDVIIDEAYRGQGLSKWLMRCIDAHPKLQGMRRWLLGTSDAHQLYAKYGFTPLASPARWMERHNPNVYKKNT